MFIYVFQSGGGGEECVNETGHFLGKRVTLHNTKKDIALRLTF